MKDSGQLKGKTTSGLLWSFCELIAIQGIQFIVQVILARLIMPKDFGIIGMITVFIAISNSFIDCGFSQALIREKTVSQDDYSTIFYFNIFMALILYCVLFLSASAISDFFKEPQLLSIIRVFSLVIVLDSFGLIQRTILTKTINFKTQTKINMVSSIASGIIGIMFAYMGYGIWSLVIKTLFMQFMQSLLLWVFKNWKPSFVFKTESFKRLFAFGAKLLISGMLDTIYNNICFVIIGRVFSASELGYYTNAAKLKDMVCQSITTPVQRVSYPVLSTIQEDNDKLKLGFKKITRVSVFLNFPMMIGLAIIANPLIYILLGNRWMPSVPYFQLLCFAGMIYPVHAINLNILQVKGRSDLFLRLEIIKKMIFSVLIVVVLSLRLGIIGLIGALVLNSYISYFLNAHYSSKLISYSIKEQLVDIFPVFSASTLMALIVYLCGLILSDTILIKMIFQIIIGCFAYVRISKLIKIQELNAVYELILSLFKRLELKRLYSR